MLHSVGVFKSGQLRQMMESICFVALAGQQSSGKSSLTQKLVGLEVSHLCYSAWS